MKNMRMKFVRVQAAIAYIYPIHHHYLRIFPQVWQIMLSNTKFSLRLFHIPPPPPPPTTTTSKGRVKKKESPVRFYYNGLYMDGMEQEWNLLTKNLSQACSFSSSLFNSHTMLVL
jgi:ABC-type glycerol-3-phosphate transport system permease component